MPRSLLSSRYNMRFLETNNQMSALFANTSQSSKISDPLKRIVHSRRQKRNSKEFGARVQSHQLSLLRSNEWLRSDLVPFTIRYELEIRHNMALMTHYGEKPSDESDDYNNVTALSDSISTENGEEMFDSDDGIEYFEANPRKINFDLLEDSAEPQNLKLEVYGENDDKKENLPKKKKSKVLSDESNKEKKFCCDVCKKVFDKRCALNSHMLLHSGDKPFRCSYKTCTKQYADRSNLRAHQRSKKHHNWKIFCPQCTKPFSEQRYLNLHSLSACRKYLASVNKKA